MPISHVYYAATIVAAGPGATAAGTPSITSAAIARAEATLVSDAREMSPPPRAPPPPTMLLPCCVAMLGNAFELLSMMHCRAIGDVNTLVG